MARVDPEKTLPRLPAVGGQRSPLARLALRKASEVTLYFWIIKLLTTALGESSFDFLVRQLNPTFAVLLGGTCFTIALGLQFATSSYAAWIYWLTVIMVAIFGTMVADVAHIVLGIPDLLSMVVFAAALVVIFLVWYRVEHTLSIHGVGNPR